MNEPLADKTYVQERYSWDDDTLEITMQLIHETDENRLASIAKHFKVDLSEIRDYLNKKKQTDRFMTNGDLFRSMNDEKLAAWFGTHACCMAEPLACTKPGGACRACWLAWMREGAEE